VVLGARSGRGGREVKTSPLTLKKETRRGTGGGKNEAGIVFKNTVPQPLEPNQEKAGGLVHVEQAVGVFAN